MAKGAEGRRESNRSRAERAPRFDDDEEEFELSPTQSDPDVSDQISERKRNLGMGEQKNPYEDSKDQVAQMEKEAANDNGHHGAHGHSKKGLLGKAWGVAVGGWDLFKIVFNTFKGWAEESGPISLSGGGGGGSHGKSGGGGGSHHP